MYTYIDVIEIRNQSCVHQKLFLIVTSCFRSEKCTDIHVHVALRPWFKAMSVHVSEKNR